jgi:hypothetical protein
MCLTIKIGKIERVRLREEIQVELLQFKLKHHFVFMSYLEL